jgi:hypothetical protein
VGSSPAHTPPPGPFAKLRIGPKFVSDYSRRRTRFEIKMRRRGDVQAMFSREYRYTGPVARYTRSKENEMSSIARLLAAAVLLGTLAGCAGMMPNWTPNVQEESPPIYEPSPSN